MTQAQLQALPLLFSFKQVVAGNGFFAGVKMDGRALLETEHAEGHEESWITGIAPVGITGGGAERGMAFVEFRRAWTEVIFDIAAEAQSFTDFQTACVAFLASEKDALTAHWTEAVATVRREGYVDPSLCTKDADENPVSFEVVDLAQLQPVTSVNQVDTPLQVAAGAAEKDLSAWARQILLRAAARRNR